MKIRLDLFIHIAISRYSDMDELLATFKALADPTRLRIIKMLTVKPLCVCEVMHVLRMAQSTTSKHLQILSNAGFLESMPGGTWTVYRIAKAPRNRTTTQIMNMIKGSKATAETEEDAAKAKKADRNRICIRRTGRTLKG